MRIRTWCAAAALAAAALELGGCSAAAPEPTPRDVTVQTPGVPGAECTLTSPTMGAKTVTTPASINVVGQDVVSVSCRKECFQEGSAVIPPDAKDANISMAPVPKCKVKKKKA